MYNNAHTRDPRRSLGLMVGHVGPPGHQGRSLHIQSVPCPAPLKGGAALFAVTGG